MVDRFFLATKAFIVNEGEVLIVQESEKYEDGVHPGKYEVVGGRLEPGEHFEDALRREVREETGMKVNIGEPFLVDEWRPVVDGQQWQIVGIFFECETDSRDVELGRDHQDYEWIDPENHREYEMIDSLHDRFEAFLDR